MVTGQKTLSGGVAEADKIVNPTDQRKQLRLQRITAVLTTVDYYQKQETPVNRDALAGRICENFVVSRETVMDDLRSLEGAQCLRHMGVIEVITPRGRRYLEKLRRMAQ